MYGFPNQMNPYMGITGGYPNGYPPTMLPMGQSPFIAPFPNPQPPIGGGMPLEVTMSNGTTMNIPATPGFNPGGATINQGGFNPTTGMVTPAMGEQGFNPYTAAASMPSIGQPMLLNGQMVQPPQSQGLRVYDPAYHNPQQGVPPMMGGYGIYSPMGIGGVYNPYGQNQFNSAIQQFLYDENDYSTDAITMLENIILSDEEREKIDHNRNTVIGRDYYGRPIYNNATGAYQANQKRQQEFEEARENWQKHFTALSRIAHGYDHEDIDEEATMKRFDPVPPQPQTQQKVFNFFSATDREKKEYERDSILANTKSIEMRFAQQEQYEKNLEQQKAYAFAQIKASHDKMIGVEPGEHYDLKTFLDNGYKIRVNIAHQKAKSANRNGTNKYSRSDFRANLAQTTNSPVPVTSKDDEYISIEEMLKGIYDRNKRVDSVLRGQNGQTMFGAMPQTSQFNSEMEAHQHFLQAMQEKKQLDEVRGLVV